MFNSFICTLLPGHQLISLHQQFYCARQHTRFATMALDQSSATCSTSLLGNALNSQDCLIWWFLVFLPPVLVAVRGRTIGGRCQSGLRTHSAAQLTSWLEDKNFMQYFTMPSLTKQCLWCLINWIYAPIDIIGSYFTKCNRCQLVLQYSQVLSQPRANSYKLCIGSVVV